MNLGMLRLFKIFILFFLLENLYASSQSFDFDLIKKGKQDNNTLLVVGGIQGDEPGGFMAASLITTHYRIKKGSIWVVPNLNFYSIIKRSRGPFGDMNRKFAQISEDDPDYNSIQRIKKYITSNEVKLVLNLHDGSGFFRSEYKDNMHAPSKWGQSSVIDQELLNVDSYGNLGEIAQKVCEHVNSKLIDPKHAYSIKNTKTRLGDKEMEKTLTYFAINNGKAAFGNEASKNLPLHERTYYHLLALEKYMDIMGIEYERHFELNPFTIKNVIDNDIYMSFYDDKIQLPLSQIRSVLRYFPIKKDGTLEFSPSSPLLTVIKKDDVYAIHYGNRRLALLTPDYLELEKVEKDIGITIDGKKSSIPLGSIVNVHDNFKIEPMEDIRVNIIGFVHEKVDEAGVNVNKNKIGKRFSIDKNGNIFRVEFYKKNKFAGMVLVNFDKNSNTRVSSFDNSNSKEDSTNSL
ncbi:deacylase [Halarcobacter mediterraneus]|uniref:Deacylase n=1 Tax=Halarcobacter mediterraneus TaxID=2023153 RepID=A0A4Q1AQ66_9BACT|nr:M99 family carboxypeptidase catalytic domain-containing protein [Halarcobacter mediterraneus]RXK11514.1 deacylase [Halarcobacter mediterraneus]